MEIEMNTEMNSTKQRKARVAGKVANVDGVRAYETAKGIRYSAQVRIAGRPAQSKSFDTREAAIQWKRTQEVGDAKPQPDRITMPECFTRYMERRAQLGNPVGEAMASMYRRLSAHPILATVRVDQMTAEVAISYCAARKTVDRIHPSTILSEYVRINLAIRGCAMFFGWGAFDPLNKGVGKTLKAQGLIAESTKRDRRPSGGELDSLIAHFAERRVAGIDTIPMDDIVRVNALNAFRRGEVVELLWSNLDTEAHGFYVDRKDSSVEGGKRRALVPLLPAAWEIIERQPKVEGEDRVFPYSADWISKRFTAACKALKITNLRLHDLRHEAISTIAQVVGPTEAMMVSGHKTFRHFMRYVNYGKEESKKISTKLANVTLASAVSTKVTPLRAAA
jgi:integrase